MGRCHLTAGLGRTAVPLPLADTVGPSVAHWRAFDTCRGRQCDWHASPIGCRKSMAALTSKALAWTIVVCHCRILAGIPFEGLGAAGKGGQRVKNGSS